MALVKFDNGRKERAVSPLFNDVFESFFNDAFVSDRMVSRVPAVNICETPQNYSIELAAPGLSKEDFKINIDRNNLIISVEKKTDDSENNKQYSKREFNYVSFVRSFTLPEEADKENIEAQYMDGILKIVVSKVEEARNQPKQIEIK